MPLTSNARNSLQQRKQLIIYITRPTDTHATRRLRGIAAVMKQENVVWRGKGVSEAGTLKGGIYQWVIARGLVKRPGYRARGGILSRAIKRLRQALLRHQRWIRQIILRAILCSEFYLSCFFILFWIKDLSCFKGQPRFTVQYCSPRVIVSITLRHEWNFFVTTLLTQRDIKGLLGYTTT